MQLNEAKQILNKNGYSLIKENALADYLMDKVEEVAREIYIREINDYPPTLDGSQQPSREYLKRFDYMSNDLKKAVKRAATVLKADLDSEGLDFDIHVIENEIYDALRMYAK